MGRIRAVYVRTMHLEHDLGFIRFGFVHNFRWARSLKLSVYILFIAY